MARKVVPSEIVKMVARSLRSKATAIVEAADQRIQSGSVWNFNAGVAHAFSLAACDLETSIESSEEEIE